MFSDASIPFVLQWERRCEVLKKDAASSSEIYHGSSHGNSDDIQTNYEIINNFYNNNIHILESNLSKDVMPLQYATNENYQVHLSDISVAGKVGSLLCDLGSYTPSRSLTCMSMLTSDFVHHFHLIVLLLLILTLFIWRSEKYYVCYIPCQAKVGNNPSPLAR